MEYYSILTIHTANAVRDINGFLFFSVLFCYFGYCVIFFSTVIVWNWFICSTSGMKFFTFLSYRNIFYFLDRYSIMTVIPPMQHMNQILCFRIFALFILFYRISRCPILSESCTLQVEYLLVFCAILYSCV